MLRLQGSYPEAIGCFREALEIGRKKLPPGHEARLLPMSCLAYALIVSGRGEEAIPLIDEYVPLAAGWQREQLVPPLIRGRLRHFQKAKDGVGCRTSAEMWEGLNRTNAAFFYDAACFRAVTAAVIRATEGSPQAARNAAAEADRAMDWLSKAFAAGYAEIGHMKLDNDLDALRQRNDFQKLLADLEAKIDEIIAVARFAANRTTFNERTP
jgi:hypothetical protein